MERVDKAWKDKGLAGYSTSALLGTLQHYGAAVDEATAKQSLAGKFPMEVARAWQATWTGKGQFAAFPYAAADELLKRLFPETPTPLTLASALITLTERAVAQAQGKPPEGFDRAFELAEAAIAQLPTADDRREVYLRELLGTLRTVAGPFNAMPKALFDAGQKDAGLRFAKVVEAIFTERAGCVTALLRALGGDAAALDELKAKAADAAGDMYGRYAALDCLAQASAFAQLRETGLGVFDAAAQAQDWELADAVAHTLADEVRSGRATDNVFVAEVERRFALAHRHAHH